MRKTRQSSAAGLSDTFSGPVSGRESQNCADFQRFLGEHPEQITEILTEVLAKSTGFRHIIGR
jgi:hypothetical protein